MPDTLLFTDTASDTDVTDTDMTFSCDSLSLEEVGITMFLL